MKTCTRKMLYLGVAIALAVSSCLGALGCSSSQTKEANKLIDEFNTHIAKNNKLDKKSEELIKGLNTKAQTKDEFRNNVKILEEAKGIINEQGKELTEGGKVLDKAKALEINEEFKKYIQLEQEANDANKELFKLTEEVVKQMKDLYKALGSEAGLSKDQVSEKTSKIVELNGKVSEQQKKAEELKSKATEYYKEKDLGK